MKIAYFSPLPLTRSGIADYSAGLLPHLGRRAEITLFVDEPETVAEPLRGQFDVRPLSEYPQRQWQYDLPLYQIGNSSHHESIYNMSLHYPGVIVLHEAGLHHFIVHRSAGQGNAAAYTRELGYAEGLPGINHYWACKLGLKQNNVFERPLNNRIVDVNLGVIVHSHYVRQQLQPDNESTPVQVIPHWAVLSPEQKVDRAGLGLPENQVIFASLGQITPQKQIPLILQLLSRLRKSRDDIYFLIVGEDSDGVVDRLVAENGWQTWVKCTGYVADLQKFGEWLRAADVVINLRQPTLGETSGVALRAMAAGKPLLVYDQGWYGEIPAAAALKVPVLDEAALATAVRRLAESADLRRQLGQAGREYIQTSCAPEKAADAYWVFLRQIRDKYKDKNV